MDPKELLEQALQKLATEKARADAATEQLASEKTRADTAEGTVATLTKQLTEAEKAKDALARLDEKEIQISGLEKQLASEKARADRAESPERLRAAVKARVAVEGAAAAILGDTRLDNYGDRELMTVVLEKLHGPDPALAGRSDDYVRASFDAAVRNFRVGAESLAQLAASVRTAQPAERTDSKSARAKMIERVRGQFQINGSK